MPLSPTWLSWPQTLQLVAAFPEGGLRFVGGAVRDALLGKPAGDIDAATTLAPAATMAALSKAGIQAIPTGIDHGTVTALVGGKRFEITTLRKDVATDGRHAEVAFTDDWKEDAARRDFTMNALYLSASGELTDFFGGEADARAGRVRFIGGAGARIEEDYLRILRFFRFHAYYGKEPPDAQAVAACAAHARGIETLSGERIRQEMLKLFAAPLLSPALGIIPPDILRRAFGFTLHNTSGIAALETVEKATGHPPDALLRLALLLPSDAALMHLAGKWRLSNDMQKILKTLLQYAPKLKADTDAPGQKKLLRAIGKEAFQRLALLRMAQDPSHAPHYRTMLDFATGWDIPEFPVRGEDLIARGVPAGKGLGEQLAAMEAAWEASDYTLTKEALLNEIIS